jgi:hypothetical protein
MNINIINNTVHLPLFNVLKPTLLVIDSYHLPHFDGIKILLIIEPPEIGLQFEKVYENHKYYDFILTWSENILSKCNNSVLFEFGSSFVNPNSIEKKLKVTMLCNSKSKTNGHILRSKIWHSENLFKIKTEFYNSSNLPIPNQYKKYIGNLPNDKIILFNDSMFHICVENVNIKNWFTEKIIDCFLTKTIPIYWGCENISNYFNIDGIICFNTIEECFDKVNKLTEFDYNNRIVAIEENYQTALYYMDYNKRLKEKILEITNENFNMYSNL